MILTYHMLETRLKLNQRYANRIKEHPNILVTNLMKEIKTSD